LPSTACAGTPIADARAAAPAPPVIAAVGVVAEMRLSSQTKSTGSEWIFNGKDGEIRVKVSGTLRANNGEAIKQAVMADLGIAISPTWLIQEDLKAGRVQEILRDFSPAPAEINAVYPSARHVSAKVRAFTEFLKAEFEKIPALRVR